MGLKSQTIKRLAIMAIGVTVFLALTCCNGGEADKVATDTVADQEATTQSAEPTTTDAVDEFGDDYWLSSCLAPTESEYGPSFTAASLTETELSFSGSARVGQSEDEASASEGDWTDVRQWNYVVTEETVFEGRNAFGPNTAYPFDEAKEVIESLNGLGIHLHVQQGAVTYVCFVS